MKKIKIIDYGLANLKSVYNAFSYFDSDVAIIDTPKDLVNSNLIVLPGVGSFDKGMEGLRFRGFDIELKETIMEKKIPFLGICLGMQFLFSGSEEGKEKGIGIFKSKVKSFERNDKSIKVPHIGWNTVSNIQKSKTFSNFPSYSDFYFVHSFYVPMTEEFNKKEIFICNYGIDFVAGFEKENIIAVQFHPEKSQITGMKMIENILGKI